jgi:branched-chain amino acid transport system substrate-binding protein
MKYPKRVFHVILLAGASMFFAVSARAGSLKGDPEKTVKIGLLIQDDKSVAAKQGAEIAVGRVNQNSGPDGFLFELVVRSMEGPWGTGSKQAVDLIFNEKVWALLGSHDGRNAHLVEQAATKAIVPFVSAWAGDPSLSRAFVPWFFNCVPNDIQQVETLFEEICQKRNMSRIFTIYDEEYDSKTAFTNFLKKSRMEKKPDPVQYNYKESEEKSGGLADLITKSGAECIVLFCDHDNSLEILSLLEQNKLNIPVFSSHYVLNENLILSGESVPFDNDLLIAVPQWSVAGFKAFADEYRKRFGSSPGMAAAYAFDGMNLLIQAIRIAGTSDREQIQKSLEKITYEGVTGIIRFDEMGNREGPYIISMLKNGVPAMTDKY